MPAGSIWRAAAVTVALCVAGVAQAGSVVSRHFRSEALGREWAYNVYLPDGYENGTLRYPVMYLLHGNAGDENEWVAKGHVDQAADALIAAHEIPPTVIIMPEANTTWYVDRKEKMETAFLADLVPEVERSYRVFSDGKGRVIGGESMGGYGSLRFVLKHPDMFAAMALMSPAIYVPEPPATSSARRVGVFGDTYDPSIWTSLNYPTLLDAFYASKKVIPLYIDSGDHDDFMIEWHAANLYKIWREHNWPAEYRVVDGIHSFGVWRNTVGEALRFIYQNVRRPEPMREATR